MEWNSDIYYNMDDLENTALGNISQIQKDKYYLIPLIWDT